MKKVNLVQIKVSKIEQTRDQNNFNSFYPKESQQFDSLYLIERVMIQSSTMTWHLVHLCYFAPD